MAERWSKVPGNIRVYRKGNYEIALNANHGHAGPGIQDGRGDYWWWEVETTGNRRTWIGEAPTLAAAKKLADLHIRK